MMEETQKYESKLSDAQWEKLEPLLIGRKGGPGASAKDNRLFIDALLWLVASQAAWSKLPPLFGPQGTVYMRFRRWTECDFWRDLTQRKIDDPELLQMLEAIVCYGDMYTNRLKQRARRRVKKNAYRSTAGGADSESSARYTPSPEDSILHWVGLVNA